jgi:hypothetical protein
VDQTLTPGIQAREGVGGTTCVSPRPAGEPSTVTRDRAFLEDPAVAVGIVEEDERVPVAARPSWVIPSLCRGSAREFKEDERPWQSIFVVKVWSDRVRAE